jgi:hypothetical protein
LRRGRSGRFDVVYFSEKVLEANNGGHLRVWRMSTGCDPLRWDQHGCPEIRDIDSFYMY